MSDPVTNVEIEDVLASIRRLVSDEPASSDMVSKPQAPKADKLVLTPSLRVADGRDLSTAAPKDNSQNTAAAMQLGAEYAVPAEADTESNAAVEEAEAAPLVLENADSAPDVEPEPIEEIPLEDRIAGLEAAVAETADQWEPDGDEEDAFAGVDVEAPYWEDDDADEDLNAEVTPLHAPHEHVKQDEPITVDAQPDVQDAPSEEAQSSAALDDLTELGLPQGLIDEEMLRDLVAEIVRQELQGSLGERITRNVRKLVRREIQRALTSRDLS
ncbi:hypothetical protein [Thalassovita mediterranea]|jgi:hypothetical protein|uniref:Uncharacterized protein n=1 Tax=Thalassovita mediterranea TaxID=340021 RepID=A0A0P1GNJ1_9RHOB|nr:hypothetical protein [Thalassovita mediterranea]CUH83824.1 hypothetical protein TM5383_01026 [Thalassovita mediterranea]SIS28350.1 hypothetical protein SAMN05421685_101488 [Thalassovita mediterranea]